MCQVIGVNGLLMGFWSLYQIGDCYGIGSICCCNFLDLVQEKYVLYIKKVEQRLTCICTVVLGEERRVRDGRPVRPAGVQERDEQQQQQQQLRP